MDANWNNAYENAIHYYNDAISAYRERKFDNVLIADIIGVGIEKLLLAYLEFIGNSNKPQSFNEIINEAKRQGIGIVNEREFVIGANKILSLKNPNYFPSDEDILTIIETISQVKLFININIKSKEKSEFSSV